MHGIVRRARSELTGKFCPVVRLSGRPAVIAREIVEQSVSLTFGVPAPELRAPTRSRAPVAFARQVAMYLAHVTCGLSMTDVGTLFGRDRSTVAYACSLVEDRRDDPVFDRSLVSLESAIAILMKVCLFVHVDAGHD